MQTNPAMVTATAPRKLRVRDPLNGEQTAYDILELAPGVDAQEIEAAFRRGLVKKVNVQKLTSARQVLKNPAERALIDLFYYDADCMGRLTPNPIHDPSLLTLPKRGETAQAWENQLRASFPDPLIAHSLAVLWYWWAMSLEQGVVAGQAKETKTSGSVEPLGQIWKRVIGFWAMLAASQTFWDGPAGIPSDLGSQIQRTILERLSTRLQDFAQKHRGNAPARARTYEELELDLGAELRAARLMANTGIARTPKGRVICGTLLLERLQLTAVVRNQVKNALQRNSSSETLQQLFLLISPPYARIAELVGRGKPQVAIDALTLLPTQEKACPEYFLLLSQAYFDLGKQQASLGQISEAIASWSQALSSKPSEKLRATIEEELVTTCQARAATLQQHQRDEAIAILETGLGCVDDARLQLTLAEILSTRGIERINQAQEKANAAGPDNLLRDAHQAAEREDWDSAIDNLKSALRQVANTAGQGFRAAMQAGLSDLERAAELGSKRAQEQVTVARELCQRDLSATIKKNLAVCLANRAGKQTSQALVGVKHGVINAEEAIRKLESARSDLKEASVLDPSSEARESLSQVEQFLNVLGNPAAYPTSHPTPPKVGFGSALAAFIPSAWWLIVISLWAGFDNDQTIGWLIVVAWAVIFLVYWGRSNRKQRQS